MFDNFVYFYKCIISSNFQNVLTIYVAVTSIMISVVIFLAEIISNKDISKIEKQIILYFLEIEKLLRNAVIFLIFLLFFSILNNVDVIDMMDLTKSVVFLIVSFFAILYIIYVSFEIVKTFYLIINYKTNVNFKFNLIKKYLSITIDSYYVKRKEYFKKIEKNKKYFNKFIKSEIGLDYIINNNNEINDLKYVKLFDFFSYKDGIFENVDYENLILILNNVSKKYRIKIFFNKNIGDEINLFSIIVSIYIDKNLNNNVKIDMIKDEFEKNLNEIINIKDLKYDYKNYYYKINEIFKLILDFESDFNNSHIISLYDNYYKKGNKEVIQLFSDVILKKILLMKENGKNISDDTESYLKNYLFNCIIIENKIEKYNTSIVNQIMMSADYLLRYSNDNKRNSYFYSNKIVDNLLNAIDYDDELGYYECVISNLLASICYLFKDNKLDEIIIIISNIYLTNDLKQKKYFNLLFVLGIIKSIIISNRLYDNYIDININKLKEIINITKSRFLNLNDEYDFILYVNMLLNGDKYSKLYSTIHFIEMLILKDEYSNHYFGSCVDEKDLSIYLFSILDTYTICNYNEDKITREMFNILKYIFNSSIDARFYDVFGITVDNIKLVKDSIFKPCLERSLDLKNKFIAEINIDDKINVFKSNLKKMLDVVNFEKDNIKIEIDNNNINNSFLCSENFFHKESIDFFSDYTKLYSLYFDIFYKQFSSKISEEIDKNVYITYDTINEFLDNVVQIDDYCLCTSRYNKRYVDNYCFRGKIIDKLYIVNFDYFNKDYVYFIKKNNIPKILFGYPKLDKQFNKNNVLDEYKYIEVVDLNRNKKKMEKISRDKNVSESDLINEIYVCVGIGVNVIVKEKNEYIRVCIKSEKKK